MTDLYAEALDTFAALLAEATTGGDPEPTAMTVATYRGTVPTYADEGHLWQQFMPELQRQGLTPTGPGGVFEHDPTYVDEDPDLSVFLPVPPGTTAEGPVEVIEVPEQRAVVARVVGPFSQISQAHAQITAFLTDNGLSEAPVQPHAAR